ncbi:Serine/threonine-protein phosphatase 5 [Durusdinium trenchii]|uniref:Serine/threonine-protein phosphatase 5 n=1 Tax=Durusdinium trenchii TaxID=1381693 RepID=A0ABP0LUP8_9DINO
MEDDRQKALGDVLDHLADGHLPTEEEALRLLQAGAKHFAQLPTLVPITVSKGASLHVVGDLHGQFCELMTVISLCGLPSQSNMFLFNGDFVDRGGRSVEVRSVDAAGGWDPEGSGGDSPRGGDNDR